MIRGAGRALLAGEKKYDSWNFIKGHGRLQLCAAAIRHLLYIMEEEFVDEDTTALLDGDVVYHWDCVVANMNMLIYQYYSGTLINDSPKLEDIKDEK